MYFYEDRMRAVALYIKVGKRAKAAIHQMGYRGSVMRICCAQCPARRVLQIMRPARASSVD